MGRLIFDFFLAFGNWKGFGQGVEFSVGQQIENFWCVVRLRAHDEGPAMGYLHGGADMAFSHAMESAECEGKVSFLETCFQGVGEFLGAFCAA